MQIYPTDSKLKKQVLLTGATGFVGRQVLRELMNHDVRVTVVVRDGKQSMIELISNVGTIVSTSDLFIEDSNWWYKTCQGVDTVIHVAWYAEPQKYLQSSLNLNCLSGTLNLAKGAAQAGVRRFVGIGTCFEYQLTNDVLSVETPLEPLTPYAAAKAAAYMMLSQWFPRQCVSFAWCRLFYLYGEGEDKRRLIPYLRTQLAAGKPAELTSGKQIRDFIDVCKAGSLITKAALSDAQGPLNVCSGIPITVRQLAEKIADEYGRRDLLKFSVRPDNVTDPPCVVGLKSKI